MLQFIINRIFSARFRAANSRSQNVRLGKTRKNSVPRPTLYCVWIPAHEGENAPLIRVWIDPLMSAFDSQAHVHEPDLAAARSEEAAALGVKGDA